MEAFLKQFQVPAGSTTYNFQRFDENDFTAGALFNVPDERIEDLMRTVDGLVKSGGNYPLLERQTAITPAVFDLDFKFKADLPETSFLTKEWVDKHVVGFVESINKLYREFLEVPTGSDFIIQQRIRPYERENKSQGKFVCDGFHIIAPSLRAEPSTHDTLRKIGLQRGFLDKLEFPVPVLEDAGHWWDASVVRPFPRGNAWFVFGCGKADRPPYRTIWEGVGCVPVEEEGGGMSFNLKPRKVRTAETKVRRLASYNYQREVAGLVVKPSMAKALLAVSQVPVPKTGGGGGSPMPSSSASVVSSATGGGDPDLIASLNEALGLPLHTPWQVKEKNSRKFCGMPITTTCLCDKSQHIKPKSSQLIVNATTQKSGRPSAVAMCFDYANNHGNVKLDDQTALKLYGVLFNSDEPQDEDIYSHPNYLAMRETFEEEVVKICVPVCFNVKMEDEWLSLTEDKLKQLFRNKGFSVETEKGKERKSFIQTWLTDPNMLTYTRFAFYPEPDKCPPTHFNEFKGWAYQRYISEETVAVPCPELLEVILALSGGEQEAMDYVLDWMAQIIQEPLVKTGVALCFGGQQGTGKDFVWDWFRRFILGDDITLMTAQPETDLFGSFTTRIKNRLLIKMEEGEGKTFHGNSDKFKSFITSPTTTYHPKGIDPTTIAFPARFVITTNNFNAVKVEPEDRRFCFFKAVAHAHAQDRAWFGKLATRIGNCETGGHPTEPGIIKWFMDMLKGRKIAGKNWITERPKTLQWSLMRTMNMPYHYHFLEWLCFEANPHMAKDKGDLFGRVMFRASDLYKTFCDWKAEQGHTGEKNSMTSTKFFCLLKETGIDGDGIVSGRDSKGSTYTLNPRAIRKWLVAKNYVSNPANGFLDAVGDVAKPGCLIKEPEE